MAFPNIDFLKIKTDANTAMQSIGNPAVFTLHDGGTVSVKVSRAVPSAKSAIADMTAGMQQYELKMFVLYDAWHAQAPAGRAPQKGDVVEVADRVHAIQSSVLIEAGGVAFAYEVRILG